MINNVIALVVSYLVGSVNFSIVFSKLLLKQDIRTKGSGNAGFYQYPAQLRQGVRRGCVFVRHIKNCCGYSCRTVYI